jgi:UDP-2-acetamido-3-amino-2,3-dideoxy-glucuronate N-acetyltransferase
MAASDSTWFAHPTAVIDEGCIIGKGTKIWHFSHIMSGCIIGEDCNLGQNVVISPEVIIGNNVKIQNNVSVYTGVICEDDVFLGPSIVFTNVINPRSAVPRKDRFMKTFVKKGASIGANATIICGNTIGEYAFIGAGAVVTKNVKPYALIIGNPGKQNGWMSEYGHQLYFDENNLALCPESGEKYLLEDESVRKISNQ